MFTPYSEFPEKNQTELGYQLSYYTIQGTTDDKGIYFHHSFSKNIRYGAEFYTGSDKYQVFHHFSYRLGSILEKSNFNLIFSGAINYLSTEKPVLCFRANAFHKMPISEPFVFGYTPYDFFVFYLAVFF